MIDWIRVNWAWAAPLGGWLLITLINSVLRHYHDAPKGLQRALRVVLDVLSVLTNRDSPGTLKAPLTVSRKPEALYLKQAMERAARAAGEDAMQRYVEKREAEEQNTPVEVPR